jgi:NADH-ubiquinone oxidoreductase chain 2
LDSLYIITSISDINSNDLWYKPDYINFALVIFSAGFLFKVSAAPFHFWSPDVYDAIPTIVTTFVTLIAKISIFILLLQLVYYTNCNNKINIDIFAIKITKVVTIVGIAS